MKTQYPETPELDKMKAAKDESQIIGSFLDRIGQDGVCLAEYDKHGDTLQPIRQSIEQTLANYFGIDLEKVEAERRAILDYIRKST